MSDLRGDTVLGGYKSTLLTQKPSVDIADRVDRTLTYLNNIPEDTNVIFNEMADALGYPSSYKKHKLIIDIERVTSKGEAEKVKELLNQKHYNLPDLGRNETRNMETKAYAALLRTTINANSMRDLIVSIGDDLNSRSLRMLKATIIEQALGRISKVLIHADEAGYDYVDFAGKHVELKYKSEGIFSSTLQPHSSIELSIKNYHGKTKNIETIDFADYYIILQENAMAICSSRVIKQYAKPTETALKVKIPFEELHLIYIPDDLEEYIPRENPIKVSEMIDKIVDLVISQFTDSQEFKTCLNELVDSLPKYK